jgi:DNA-binding CsgD family transcriptional regulator
VEQSAEPPPARSGGEFFATPDDPTQRRYEALRCYLYEGASAAEVADRFGYTVDTVRTLVRDFRAGRRGFFVAATPGPKSAPAKDAARDRIIALRTGQGLSIDEIAAVLAAQGTPLNRTGIAEVLADEGLPRLWRRPDAERGIPPVARDRLARAGIVDFAALDERLDTRFAGLLLAVPDLVALDVGGLAAAAGYPGTRDIPAASYLLALVATKLIGLRRVGHVDDIAADVGAGLFAGLSSIPKTTALRTYSYRLDHPRQTRLLSATSRAMVDHGLVDGADFDLDFHAIQHFGDDPALEKHYVPKRSQRTRSVLTFFAQDADTHNLIYANADISKAAQNREVLAFADYWRDVSGAWPAQLVFDQRLCTQAELAELDARGITFITLRMRSTSLMRHIAALDTDAGAWKTVRLDRPGRYTTPRVVDQPAVRLSRYPGTVRQLIVAGLGRDTPTVIITNDTTTTAKRLIERYARRMTIEQRLAEAIRAFHLDALGSAVALNVDCDVVLTVLADAVCAALARRLPGYHDATPDLLQRRFLDTEGTIHTHDDRVTVRLNRRAYSPVLRAADLPPTPVPWWNGRTLHFEFP